MKNKCYNIRYKILEYCDVLCLEIGNYDEKHNIFFTADTHL